MKIKKQLKVFTESGPKLLQQGLGENIVFLHSRSVLLQLNPDFSIVLLQELNLRILGLNLLHKLINEWIVS